MIHTNFSPTRLGRLMKGPRLCALLGLLLARAALGTDALYENDAIVIYNGAPHTYPPQIDAINFVNNGTFIIDWNIFPINPYTGMPNYATTYYETLNTINYTNNSLMSSDDGFWFDTQTTGGSHLMAGSFYNPGEIDCSYQFLAWATNIVNPGTVNVPGSLVIVNLNPATFVTAMGGLMQFTGQNVDLSRSTLTVVGGQGTGHAVGLYWLKGADTNSDWDASFDLGPTQASPAWPVRYYAAPPNGFGFPNIPLNTTPYFNQVPVGTNLVIIRSVFIQDTSPNVSYNVYFGPAFCLGTGDVTVEWRGGYVDPATGNPATNYLYLNDNYLQGVATNQVFFNGIPDNFTFSQGLTQAACLPGTPATNGFFNVFSSGAVTNRFAYVSAQLIATSVGISDIPNGAITNLPVRIQISASRELNLELAQIAQPDYLSLQSTNQFDGNAGARIAAPFSDINLGVTNGYLTITNLLPQSFPVWGGTVQAWSTRWLVMATNFVGTNAVVGTNDFRVLIVASQLTPTVLAQVQDLILHATNSLVLSDAFNVMRKLSIDARSLTLTTNAPGNGATSADGELNLESPNIFWPTSLPNLRWLTNNGAISTMNLANFGSSALPYGAFVNRGRVSNLGGSAIWALDFESSGSFFSGTNTDFVLQSLTTTLTGSIIAGGNVSITTRSLVTSNLMLRAGRSLTLRATNLLTDTGAANGNVWSVGGSSLVGLNLPIKPLAGDLLGTTIFMTAPPPNKQVVNTWAGQDYGVSTAGYTNNEAIGVLTLDALGTSSSFKFNGTGVSNAIYVDSLELLDYASYTNRVGTNLPALVFNPNLVIYYAQAMVNGASVAEKLNHMNNDHLRWVAAYAGYFSSTNIVYPDGTTNGPFNAALAQSTTIDSNGNGIPNGSDPTPFFVSSEVNLKLTLNNPPLMALLTWDSIPSATNTVYYRTNLVLGNWLPLTTNISPSLVPPAGGWPITNKMTIAVTNNPSVPHFYRVRVDPNTTLLYVP